MAATDATAYPVQNQAYRIYWVVKNLATGNPITGGLTTVAAQLMKDGAAFANSTNSPVEVNNSGYGYLDITASEMNYSCVVVRVVGTQTGISTAIEWQMTLLTDGVSQVQSGLATASELSTAETAIIAAIPTVTTIWNQADYGDAAGRATTVLGQVAQIWRYLFNSQVVDKNAQTQTLYRDNSTSALVSGSISATSTLTNKGKMS